MGNSEYKTLLLKNLQPTSGKEIWFRFRPLALRGHWLWEAGTVRCFPCPRPATAAALRYWVLHGSLMNGEFSRCSQASELPLVLVRQRFSSSPYHFPDQPPGTCGSVRFTPRGFWAPSWHLAPERTERHGGSNPQGSEPHGPGRFVVLSKLLLDMRAKLLLRTRNNGYWIVSCYSLAHCYLT